MTTADRSLVELELPDPYHPNWSELEATTREDPFMEAGVELLKEAVTLSLLAADIVPAAPYGRDEAIRCALLIRVGTLGCTMVRDTCAGDGGQQMSLSRQVIESVATLLYLSDDPDGSHHEAFVQDSLIAEREVLRDITRRQEADGDVWQIEERMQRSIDRTAKAAGIDPAKVPRRREVGWPSVEERMKLLGPTSYSAYRMGSAALHGTWHDLYRNYLEEVDNGFLPRFELPAPRPQALLVSAALITEAGRAYVTRRGEEELRAFEPSLVDLLDRLTQVDEVHERLLQE